MECVEEALLNSVFMAETTLGPDNHVRHAVPHGFVMEKLHGRGIV
jgi:L-aminopeptidase/D-esterase-like protein